MELEVWLSLVLLFFTGGLTPGPAVMLVLASSFRYGFKPALLPAFGVASANVLWLCLAASGTAVLFEIYPKATLGLKVLGILVLGWMAISVMIISDYARDRYRSRTLWTLSLCICGAIHSAVFTEPADRTHL